MSQTSMTYPFHMRAGAIKRVLRRGQHFLCGLCRSAYADESDAVGCLTECWSDLLRLDPVMPRRRGLSTIFRCRFCARDHATRQEADACAQECRGRQQARHDAELELYAALDVLPAPRKFKRRASTQTMLVAAPLRRKPSVAAPAQAVTTSQTANDSKPISAGSASVAGNQAAAEAPVATKGPSAVAAPPAKKKGDKPFFRDGAEYVCHGCSKRYFTRLEVTNCFESH